jgi:hypothetical protein
VWPPRASRYQFGRAIVFPAADVLANTGLRFSNRLCILLENRGGTR